MTPPAQRRQRARDAHAAQGATSATLRIPVTADTDIEGSETFTVALSAVADAPYKLGQPAKTAITIIDDPRPTLAFSQAAYTVNETDGALKVVVNLSSALPGDEFPRLSKVFGEGHTATSADIGSTIAQTKVQAPDGTSSVAVEIPIVDDALVEGSESFSVALTSSAAYRLVEPAAATITILDNEKPTLSFAQAAYTVNEADGELRVVVNLSSALPGDVFPQIRTVFGEGHTATSADIGSTIVQTKVQAPDGTSSVVVKSPLPTIRMSRAMKTSRSSLSPARTRLTSWARQPRPPSQSLTTTTTPRSPSTRPPGPSTKPTARWTSPSALPRPCRLPARSTSRPNTSQHGRRYHCARDAYAARGRNQRHPPHPRHR